MPGPGKRHQQSGAEKRKKKKAQDEACASLSGSMLKFVTKEDEVVPSSTDPEGLSSCTVTDAGCSTEASPSTSYEGYVEVFETTGLNLSNVILDKLQELQIPFENCRGQAYDNGANMKETLHILFRSYTTMEHLVEACPSHIEVLE
ncbi:zinc finger MYM-type 1-like protein [Labeo rohita]|uniref:Zinc finger MYM-type 1-like protein n=1 Tax=Labeo rohita TaxID=84645 RepID=A0A498P4H2_LABRO|nr:zinc finger MYM-type 1-like protein [Labeo rohita]